MASKKATNHVSETEMKQMEQSTRELIAAAPKVTVFIAPDDKDKMWRGMVNGVRYQFPKGEMIEVPEPLAEIIRNTSHMQEMKAATEKKLVEHLNLGSM